MNVVILQLFGSFFSYVVDLYRTAGYVFQLFEEAESRVPVVQFSPLSRFTDIQATAPVTRLILYYQLGR